MACHWRPEACQLLRTPLVPVVVVDLSRLQEPRDLQPKDVLTEGVGVPADDGVVPVDVQDADLRLVDPVADHLVDGILDIRVVDDLWLDHDGLCKVILQPMDVPFVQTDALEKEDRLGGVLAQDLPDLLHGGADQFLHVLVREVVALDKLIVQCPLRLQLLRAGLCNPERIVVLHAVRQVLVQAPIGVPELEHGCGEDKLHIADIHIVPPGVLNDVASSHLLRKVQEVEGEDHPLLPGEAGVHTADHVVEPQLLAPPLGEGGEHEAVAVRLRQSDRDLLPLLHNGFAVLLVAEVNDIG